VANKNDCIDFDKLKTLPICFEFHNEDPHIHYLIGEFNPPDYPMHWARSMPESQKWAILDDEDLYREVTPMGAWEVRKPLPISDPEVVAFIGKLVEKHSGFYLHPTVGLFNLTFLEQDLLQYDVTQNPKPTQPFPEKEELLKFCQPEFAYATQVIKRYYPDYTT